MKVHNCFYLLLILLFLSCQQNKKAKLDLNHSSTELAVFGEGFISTGLMERDIAISPDGNELIYTLGNHKQTRRCLVNVEKINGVWGEKKILYFSGKYQDIEPFFSPDGHRLYFASNRPNLWRFETKRL